MEEDDVKALRGVKAILGLSPLLLLPLTPVLGATAAQLILVVAF